MSDKALLAAQSYFDQVNSDIPPLDEITTDQWAALVECAFHNGWRLALESSS